MQLEDLNWDDVPQHVSVIAHKDGTVNFVVNLRTMGEDSRWVIEGDECNICGDVINPDEGWPNKWRVLERPSKQDNPTHKSEQDIVVEWLIRLNYVLQTDATVGDNIEARFNGNTLALSTDQGDIVGTDSLAEFINNRYSQLTEQANAAKREKLLADIVKAKEAYEKLVGELNELEGK